MRPTTPREKINPYKKANPQGSKNNTPQMIAKKKISIKNNEIEKIEDLLYLKDDSTKKEPIVAPKKEIKEKISREVESPYLKANPQGKKNNTPQMQQLKKDKKTTKKRKRRLVAVKKGQSQSQQKEHKRGLDDLDPSEILDAI